MGEERFDPIIEQQGEAQIAENVYGVINVNVVKEAADVKKNH